MKKEQYEPKPLRFQVQLTDHCNLNCINCLHCSPIAKKTFYPIDIYEKDIKRLASLSNGSAAWISLMGGAFTSS